MRLSRLSNRQLRRLLARGEVRFADDKSEALNKINEMVKSGWDLLKPLTYKVLDQRGYFYSQVHKLQDVIGEKAANDYGREIIRLSNLYIESGKKYAELLISLKKYRDKIK